MVSLKVNIFRGKIIESKHQILCLVKNNKGKTYISTGHEKELIYPRSAMKIFQAIPFILSKAHLTYNLDDKQIALSCSSHWGEKIHLTSLESWLKKINLPTNKILCGIHNPINLVASNNLLISGKSPNQLHNNCSGKHLGMISGCLANKIKYQNYINYNHAYQKKIKKLLEIFMESKIKQKNIAIDGCGTPQYAFPLENLCFSMINLIKEKYGQNEYSKAINLLLKSINKNPYFIGSRKSFDSQIIKVTKGRIFCKGGAEGVLFFSDFENKIGGVLKVLDGNERARPSILINLLTKFKLINSSEKKLLSKWIVEELYNHAKNKIGEIKSEIVYN